MPSTSRTPWGGLVDRRHRATGFFRVAQSGSVWWLIDPAGGRFLSKGVDTVTVRQDRIQNGDRIPYAEACRRKYRTVKAWRAAAAARLSAWGFNTLGAWSDEAVAHAGPLPLATTPVLHLADRYLSRESTQSLPADQMFPDVFDRRFEAFVRKLAHKNCVPHCDDPNVIGWFSDNELHWTSDWRGREELLPAFLCLPAKRPGRLAAIGWLRQRYGAFQAFNSVWHSGARDWNDLETIPVNAPFTRDPPYVPTQQPHDADERRNAFFADCDVFAGLVAECYFAATVGAIKAADPNHLALGCRFAYPPPSGVIAAAGRHLDVISFNCYDKDPSAVIAAYARACKPCLIGEFSFRAADSGLPNTNGAGPCVATQVERAQCYRDYVTAAFRHRSIVGCHWFEHADQPAEGRFDGENSNFGVVTIDDHVYDQLTRRMKAFNAIAADIHRRPSEAAAATAPADASTPALARGT